ncbi:hydroxyneurosporene dehydrogenase [Nocardia sp. NBC_01327]|uniref:hydroxyneurosporene dehydrogenase n=1 Tax=Nocardia sp. NBC_01327 TaxID=2903593 RepID=UPI002E13F062|nr:hydroxyneurosporene dehydrogenase [Nocardia sp. NBC_01327]
MPAPAFPLHRARKDLPAGLLSDVEDYQALGIGTDGRAPAVAEDGMRTSGASGTWEWWYFDSHLADGSTVVIVFYTKDFNTPFKGMGPMITVEIDRPDGTHIEREFKFDAAKWSASETSCDVRIGENYFRGDLEHYEIRVVDGDFDIEVSIDRTSNSWRPKTGIIAFGEDDKFFGWVVAVPQGKTTVDVKSPEATFTESGSCYHDHNWGTVMMPKVINHWYWGRAEIGPFTFIVAEIIAESEFDNVPIVVFNLARDGHTVADDERNVTVYRTYPRVGPDSPKPISDRLLFEYEVPDDDLRYEITLWRKKNLLVAKFLDKIIPNSFARGVVSRLTGFDGAYHRFTGEATVRVFRGGNVVEEYSSPTAVWELMFFGK